VWTRTPETEFLRAGTQSQAFERGGVPAATPAVEVGSSSPNSNELHVHVQPVRDANDVSEQATVLINPVCGRFR
jgi:hypothetical protein